jgi:hypothetical protein
VDAGPTDLDGLGFVLRRLHRHDFVVFLNPQFYQSKGSRESRESVDSRQEAVDSGLESLERRSPGSVGVPACDVAPATNGVRDIRDRRAPEGRKRIAQGDGAAGALGSESKTPQSPRRGRQAEALCTRRVLHTPLRNIFSLIRYVAGATLQAGCLRSRACSAFLPRLPRLPRLFTIDY